MCVSVEFPKYFKYFQHKIQEVLKVTADIGPRVDSSV